MTTRYQKSQIGDVAEILRRRYWPLHKERLVAWQGLVNDFADLFAADNPPTCGYCRGVHDDGHYKLPHVKGIGFDRKWFLAACGLESEGSECGHATNEDCMNCVVCGQCREDLNDADVCDGCFCG